MKKQIDLYLSTNHTTETSRSTLWEAPKAYIRGQIISWKSLINKQRSHKENKLMREIAKIDENYSIPPSPDMHKQKVYLQTELNLFYVTETTKRLTHMRHKYYEYGEKAGKILAHQIREQAATRLMMETRTESGQVTIYPVEINNTFKKFYMKRYTSEFIADSTLIDNFFDKLKIPTISSENGQQLEKPITKEEIENATQSVNEALTKSSFPLSIMPEFP